MNGLKPWYLRLFLWFVSRLLYRVTVLGAERLPSRGGALLVSNHLSFADMVLIMASTPRFIRFLLPEEVCRHPLLRWSLRRLKVISLPPESRTGEFEEALRQAKEAISNGEVVGVFAERSISRIGVMLPFQRELEQLKEGLDAPIIPACLDGVWGSIFSFQAGRFFWKWPRRLPYPVTVSFGAAKAANATALEIREAIADLNTEAWPHRRRVMKPLGRMFVHSARHHPLRFAMADARTPKLSVGAALSQSIFLARRFRSHWQGQKMIGVFLPPSVGGALVNLAVLLAGKVPVNLNYTLSAEALASCARQCELQTIITSKLFVLRMKADLPGRKVMLEEVAARPSLVEKLMALALAWLAPVGLLERAAGCERRPELDDLATVVFSSGSTGEPKGVMLSHYNLMSNIAQLGQTFNFCGRDRFLGVLPFFHSFGLTATLLAPAVYGLGVVFHPNPLEGKAVGELVRRYGVTYLMATPAFLQIYLRSCESADFGSLSFVMAGAEKLPDWLAAAFEEKFGIRPVEGYGCTECSPAVAINTRDYRAAGFRQIGARRGKIGHALPGMSVRIVEPTSCAPLPAGQPGLLLLRGPNVMQGYLGRPDKTSEVLRDGWYETGDIAALDSDGFLQITDRLSRFSKIGGEMVPHVKIEEKLHELAGVRELTFAVTGVPDEKKGERLVVLHRLDELALGDLLKKLPRLDLPNLWIPKANQFFAVPELPHLGTGKLDLRRVRELAVKLSGTSGLAPEKGG
jgi:acyl-[acyl-carrier-protein]-phospholipid O-acyltransferase / long-chain-fatty-acid--[acyl-carrier-protein] ligase